MRAKLRDHKMKQYTSRIGVTMVEILVATGVFAMFMVSVFGIFEYSRAGFESGSWRIQRQKHAQTFLLRLKEQLERSNHAYFVAPNGATERIAVRPTVINQVWFNQIASTTNNGIMYFSITTPYVPSQPELGQVERKGIWKGVGLDCKDKTLKLYMTGVWDTMPAHTPAVVGSPDLGKFEFGNIEGDFFTTVPDVAAVGVYVEAATQTTDIGRAVVFITVELLLEKPRSRHPVQITERITASLVDRALDEVITFPAGSFPIP